MSLAAANKTRSVREGSYRRFYYTIEFGGNYDGNGELLSPGFLGISEIVDVIPAPLVKDDFSQALSLSWDAAAGRLHAYSISGGPGTGLTQAGEAVIADEESRSSTTSGLLATPDRISGVTIPTDGLVYVYYLAQWKEDLAGTARVGIFLNDTQVQTHDLLTGVVGNALEACAAPAPGDYDVLITDGQQGLTSLGVAGGAASFPTTGYVAGGHMVGIHANAGVYDVSIRFRVNDPLATVTVRQRRLAAYVNNESLATGEVSNGTDLSDYITRVEVVGTP